MACYHPLTAIPLYKQSNGKVKYRIVPFIEDTIGKKEVCQDGVIRPIMMIPCGQCLGCRIKYSQDWANRMMLELDYHKTAYFITLTYDQEHVPRHKYTLGTYDPLTDTFVNESTGEVIDVFEVQESLSLEPDDLKNFFKILRQDQVRNHNGNKIRFYACGEYGSLTHRPHYHAIVYSLVLDDLKPYGASPKETGDSFQYYVSDRLDAIWGRGRVLVANVSWETCAYVARYILKKQSTKESDFYEMFNIYPEFTRMSRKPGIARQWFEDHPNEVYPEDRIHLAMKNSGKTIRPPKYYDKLYDAEYPEQMKKIKAQRREIAESLQKIKADSYSGSYLELLAAEELKFKQRISKLKRRVE